MFKYTVFVILLLVLPLKALADNLKIGALLDLSGEYAATGQAFLEGITLAVEEINDGGGISGRPVELVVEDTRYNMAQVQTAARKLLSIDKVSAALIMSYTEVKVAGPAFEAARVPLINLWDSAPQIEALGDYIFGIGAWTPSAGEVAAEFAVDYLQARTAAIINTNGEWSLDVSHYFARSFERLGGQVIREISLNPADTDLKSAVLKLKALKPDVIYAPFADNIPTFFKQLVAMKLGSKIITSDVLTEDVVSALGPSAEGLYHTQVADPEGSEMALMLARYKQRYGRRCERPLFTSLGYDGTHLLAEASRKAGAMREQIKDGLYGVRNFQGASGQISIGLEGSSRVTESVFQIQSGKYQLVKRTKS